MIRGRAYAALLCGASLLVLMPSVSALSCLVIRPGRGLVSEKCPNNAVACRMRIENNAVVWYEYSKLYDRNHLACILKHEYSRLTTGDESLHEDWCARKGRGTMRCWCTGNDCNEAPLIRRVYRAFIEAEERGKLSNDLPTAHYRPITTPLPIVPVPPATSPRPYFYTRIFAPPPTTPVNNYLHTNNYNYRTPKKSYWETTTMRAQSTTSDVRLTANDVRSDTNNGIRHADVGMLCSKITLIGVTVVSLLIVQISYSI